MDYERQEDGWLKYLEAMRCSPSWHRLDASARRFVDSFEHRLRDGQGTGRRANVVTPFTDALAELLRDRGMVLDASPASVEIADGLRRTADLSGHVGEERWVIEIKTGMEFNSLGAAVLEALAFRHVEPGARLMLISLYAKNRSGNLLDVLRTCGLESAFDQVHVLTDNAAGDSWNDVFAERLAKMIEELPKA